MTHPSRDRVRQYSVKLGLALIAAFMPQLVFALATPTRFGIVEFVDKSTVSGVPIVLQAKLETNVASPSPIGGQNIYFQIFRNSAWETIPDDGISISNLTTKSNGIGSVYYLSPENIAAGSYQIKAVYDGNATYEATSLTRTLTVSLSPWEERLIFSHTTGTGIPLVLVHGNGSDASPETDYRWQIFKQYIQAHPENFDRFDVYIWKHTTARAVGFNGTTGNAAELHDYVHNNLLPRYPAGTKVVFVSHSRGGLVVRSFMNRGTNGDHVYGLITLGTPHHGSPFAVPDWSAFIWGTRFGTNIFQIFIFNALVGLQGEGFDTDRLGDLNLAWDNQDGAIAGTTSLTFDVSFANQLKIHVTPEDLNNTGGSGDPTVLFSNVYKTLFGTLDDLNNREAHHDKIIAFASYDDALADNALSSAFDHLALEPTTVLLSSASVNIVTNGAVYFANDGLVPVQSALLLDTSGGLPFSSQSADLNVTLQDNNIAARKLVNRHYVFNGKSDGIRDHLDLMDTANSSYWSILSGRVRSLVRPVNAPAFDIQLSKPSYTIGDTLVAQDFRVRNPGASIAAIHLRVWLVIPGVGEITMIEAGSDGSLLLPPNLNVNLGPLSLFQIVTDFPPRGDWEFNSLIKDPATGTILSQDINPFRIQ